MNDWIDCPPPGMRRYGTSEYWCLQCKERYTVTLQLDNETGEYWGEESCPLCGRDGVLASECDDENTVD